MKLVVVACILLLVYPHVNLYGKIDYTCDDVWWVLAEVNVVGTLDVAPFSFSFFFLWFGHQP